MLIGNCSLAMDCGVRKNIILKYIDEKKENMVMYLNDGILRIFLENSFSYDLFLY